MTTKDDDYYKKLKELHEQFKQITDQNYGGGLVPSTTSGGYYPSSPCPSCGHCPHCGRGGYRTYPYLTWSTSNSL